MLAYINGAVEDISIISTIQDPKTGQWMWKVAIQRNGKIITIPGPIEQYTGNNSVVQSFEDSRIKDGYKTIDDVMKRNRLAVPRLDEDKPKQPGMEELKMLDGDGSPVYTYKKNDKKDHHHQDGKNSKKKMKRKERSNQEILRSDIIL